MEEIIDFDSWLQQYIAPQVEYWAIFEPTISPIRSVLNFFGVTSARQIWQTENLIYLSLIHI